MRRHMIAVVVALLALPVAAAADTAPDPAETAKAACKTEKHELGAKVFKQTYNARSTAKAMAACAGEREPAVAGDAKNAAKACKAERTADPDAFAAKYGSNGNKKNALGKCVSAKAKEATDAETEERVNAAKTCKTLRADDAGAFEDAYGTRRNAFGKCVSAKAG